MSLTISQTNTLIDSLDDGLKLVNQAGDTFDISIVTQNLQALSTVGMFFGAASIILNLVQAFLPEAKHTVIMRQFGLLNDNIGAVRNDIRDLENSLRWDNRAGRLSELASEIELAFRYCVAIGEHKTIPI